MPTAVEVQSPNHWTAREVMLDINIQVSAFLSHFLVSLRHDPNL